MNLCAFDTSSDVVTVAVGDSEQVLASRSLTAPRRHGELLAPLITELLEQAHLKVTDLTELIVGTGPGPFTGLRVGLVTARVMGHTLGIPVRGVCSLDALALAAVRAGTVDPTQSFRVVADALRKEVHVARYQVVDGLPRRLDGPAVATPAEVAGPDIVVGAGAHLYPEHFPQARLPLHVDAVDLLGWVRLGLPTTDSTPLYLRRPDVTVSAANAGRARV